MAYPETENRTAVTTLTINYNITRDMVEDLLIVAFEGGINYWAEKVYVSNSPEAPSHSDYTHLSEAFVKGADLIIEYQDSEVTHKKTLLTLHKLTSAIHKWVLHVKVEAEFVQCGDELCLSATSFDAVSADWIIQTALFGEVVYG